MKSNELSARWNEKQTTVYVFLGDRHVANVVAPGGKWYVLPLTLGHRRSRKLYDYPSDAIKAYFGKMIQIRSIWSLEEAVTEAESIRDKFDRKVLRGPEPPQEERDKIEGLAIRSGVPSEAIWNELNRRRELHRRSNETEVA